MPKYVVTGGAGFIGSHIAEALAGRGDEVIVIDDLSRGYESNLRSSRSKIVFHRIDLSVADALAGLFRGVSCVFHEAAIASVPESVERPLETHRANVDATLRVFKAAVDAGVRRVVYATSSAVYGDEPTLPKHERLPTEPISPYGAHKVFCEGYARVFHKVYGLETVGLRYFNVFGPRQDPRSPYSGVISLFCSALLNGRAPTIFGDGEQSRDFVFVSDVVRANLLAAEAAAAAGEVFNVGCGAAQSVNHLFRTVRELVGSNLDPVYTPPRDGDIRHSVADIERARAVLGYVPGVPFREGLRQTVDWYRQPVLPV